MNGRLAAQHHDGPGACRKGLPGSDRHRPRIKANPCGHIPARSAGDTEITTQVAAAQCNGKGGNNLQLVGNLDLRGKAAGLSSSMTRASLARKPIDPAMVRAKVAACEQPPRSLRAFASNGGAILNARLQRDWFEASHSSSRLILSEVIGRLRRARLTFQRKVR